MKMKLAWLLTPLLVLTMSFSYAQEKTISGTVTDQDGLPLPGVSVVVVGTNNGTQTDFDGNYAITASEGQTLRFSYIGQATVDRAVGASNSISVQMEEDAQALEEVVVVGYGEQSSAKLVQNVAVVKEEALEDLQVISPDQLLQGQTAGTQIVNSSGVLGSAAVIRVRGVNSINASSQPLIVIDGVPITSTEGNTLQRGGNTDVNPLSYINPNDIASLTVLKDAGATSIYGARGANGVILITTKKGTRNQKAVVTLDVSTQFTDATDLIDVFDADELRRFRTEISSIQNGGAAVTPESLNLGSFGGTNTDWVDLVTRTGISQVYDLSFRGGTEKTTYFVALNNTNQEGYIESNSLDRVSARINLDTEANDWLNFGINLSATNTILNRIGVENNTNAPLTSAFLQLPTLPAFNADGTYANVPNFVGNIAAITDLDRDEVKTFRLIGNAYAEAEILEGLKFRSSFGVDKLHLQEYTRNFDINTAGGAAGDIIVTEDRWLTNNTLDYSVVLGEKHNLNVLAGMNYEDNLRTNIQVNGTGILDNIRNVGGAAVRTVDRGLREQYRYFGLFSRLKYDYDDKYIFEGSIRRDGTTRFTGDNRFGTFWSVAGGWILSEESFIKNTDFIDFLSLRASYGVVGNDRLEDIYPSLGLFVPGARGDYNGSSGLVQTQVANPNIKWEESATLDIGIRTALFNNRLNFNVNYYKRDTKDLLLAIALPPQAGLPPFNTNAGEMENTGWEFEIGSTNIQTENFTWSTNFNITRNRNKVTRLDEFAEVDADGRRILDNGAQRAIEGEPLNNFFLVRYVGVNPQTGDAEWLDIDGNVTTTYSAANRVVVGSPLPDFSGGITNTFRYKDFDLNLLMNYSYGNDILIDGLRFVDGADALGGSLNVRSINGNFWRQPGDNAYLPSPNSTTFNNFNARSTQQLKDGSYIRLKNITLGYNLPAKFLEKSFISGLRFYTSATNLITIKSDDLDGLDPEVTDDIDPRFQGESFFAASQPRTLILGARINF